MLSDRVAAVGDGHPPDDADLVAAIWDLAWAGRLTNDTLAPLRVLTGGGPAVRRGSAPRRTTAPRPALPPRTVPVPGVFNPRPSAPAVRRYGGGSRRPAMPSRTGPPTVTGRWSLLPDRVADAGGPAATMRAHAQALTLLERHGVLTRGAVAAERVSGGFAAVYPVLRAMEETGQCRRGYFVEGLGAAQFALPGAVDRMRALAASAVPDSSEPALVLAAADPAQPYGAALPWPSRPGETVTSHRPGRKAGAVVVLSAGDLVLYVERGGKTLLSWSDDPAVLEPCAAALAAAVRDGALGRITVEKADGGAVHDSPLAVALASAGFRPTPRGLRLRG
jgi:ATP-dependent Lhr-like helicase